MFLEQLANSEIEKSKAKIKFLKQKKIKNLKGELAFYEYKNGYARFYHCLPGESPRYLKKSDIAIRDRLIINDYCDDEIKDLEETISFIEAFMKKFGYRKCKNKKRLNKFYMDVVRKSGLSAPTAEEQIAWMNADYEKNPHHPENLIYSTVAGIKVRSKSEVMIVDVLSRYNIAFRYECELDVGGRIFYPDFMIMHPMTGEIFIWEHYGMMDDPEYRSTCVSKFGAFTKEGYLPGRNFIITSESQEKPFDLVEAEFTLQRYFGVEIS